MARYTDAAATVRAFYVTVNQRIRDLVNFHLHGMTNLAPTERQFDILCLERMVMEADVSEERDQVLVAIRTLVSLRGDVLTTALGEPAPVDAVDTAPGSMKYSASTVSSVTLTDPNSRTPERTSRDPDMPPSHVAPGPESNVPPSV
jgi:hypothetical protein